ncbi:hypothetical protein TNCV_412931 [Trichonephila clavipes]|nr:hypothetical protein TNCV_412931 [Trichonephila clavipes]
MKKLRERVRKKRQDLQSNYTRSFHQRTSAHCTLSVKQFLASKCLTVLEYPLYSPDLAPYDFDLFFKVKKVLIGTHFQSVQEVKAKKGRLTEDGDT